MRFLFITLIFCYTSVTLSNWFPVGKPGSSTTWMNKNKCEQAEGQKCYDITGKDLSYYQVGFRAIDVNQTTDCADQSQCESLPFSCPAGETPTWDDKANWPGLDFSPRPADGWFIWCQLETLVVDVPAKNAHDAAQAAKAQEKLDREDAKTQRLFGKDSCVVAVNDKSALTPAQIKDCLNVLIKEVYENEIQVSDL